MTVKRITANLHAKAPAKMREFYTELFGLDVLMDMGWVATMGCEATVKPQLTFATEGGEGTPVPDISIEVDDVDALANRARDLGHDILYGPTTESWGVRRFFLHDPSDNLINVLSHVDV